MFREPTQAEIDYLWSYLEQKEGRTANEFRGRTDWFKICGLFAFGLGIICLLGLQFLGVIVFGGVGYFLISYAQKKELEVQQYLNQMTSQPYSFQIADCVLETVIPEYDNYLINQNPNYVEIIQRPNQSSHRTHSNGGVLYGAHPFCKVIMNNGDTVWCPYQTTPYAESKGIGLTQNLGTIIQSFTNPINYSQPAYFIKSNTGLEDFVIVNPNF